MHKLCSGTHTENYQIACLLCIYCCAWHQFRNPPSISVTTNKGFCDTLVFIKCVTYQGKRHMSVAMTAQFMQYFASQKNTYVHTTHTYAHTSIIL